MTKHLTLLLFIGLVWGQTAITVFDFDNNGYKVKEVNSLTLDEINKLEVEEVTHLTLNKINKLEVEGATTLTLTDLGLGTHTSQLIMDDKELTLANLDAFTDPNIKDLGKNKRRSLIIGSIAIVFGTAAHLFANKLYDDYQVARKNAGELRQQIQAFDALAITSISAGCTSFGLALNYQLKINQLNQKLQSSQKLRSAGY